MNETEKENVKEAEEEEEGIWVREQRKRSKRRRRREEQLTDRLDLALASDGGQRQWAEVRGQTSVIFLFFFSAAGCWSHVEAIRSRVGEAKKKKHSPDTGIRRVIPVQCPTRVRRQKWRVRAT